MIWRLILAWSGRWSLKGERTRSDENNYPIGEWSTRTARSIKRATVPATSGKSIAKRRAVSHSASDKFPRINSSVGFLTVTNAAGRHHLITRGHEWQLSIEVPGPRGRGRAPAGFKIPPRSFHAPNATRGSNRFSLLSGDRANTDANRSLFTSRPRDSIARIATRPPYASNNNSPALRLTFPPFDVAIIDGWISPIELSSSCETMIDGMVERMGERALTLKSWII